MLWRAINPNTALITIKCEWSRTWHTSTQFCESNHIFWMIPILFWRVMTHHNLTVNCDPKNQMTLSMVNIVHLNCTIIISINFITILVLKTLHTVNRSSIRRVVWFGVGLRMLSPGRIVSSGKQVSGAHVTATLRRSASTDTILIHW